MTEPTDPVPQRIGDAERDRAVDLLRDHLAEGRLDQVEFDDRLTQALTAKTASDLDPLFRDLPGPRPIGSAPATPLSYPAPARAEYGSSVLPAASAPGTMAATTPGWNRALVVANSVAWPVTILAITALGWGAYWWLVFVPMVLSGLLGNDRHGRDRHRNRHR